MSRTLLNSKEEHKESQSHQFHVQVPSVLEVERGLAWLTERQLLRAIDFVLPPWRKGKGKVLTRYVEPDTKKIS
jgi:hypothetical protein